MEMKMNKDVADRIKSSDDPNGEMIRIFGHPGECCKCENELYWGMMECELNGEYIAIALRVCDSHGYMLNPSAMAVARGYDDGNRVMMNEAFPKRKED